MVGGFGFLEQGGTGCCWSRRGPLLLPQGRGPQCQPRSTHTHISAPPGKGPGPGLLPLQSEGLGQLRRWPPPAARGRHLQAGLGTRHPQGPSQGWLSPRGSQTQVIPAQARGLLMTSRGLASLLGWVPGALRSFQQRLNVLLVFQP